MLQLKRRPTWDRAAQEAFDGSKIPSENHVENQPPRGSILRRHWWRQEAA